MNLKLGIAIAAFALAVSSIIHPPAVQGSLTKQSQTSQTQQSHQPAPVPTTTPLAQQPGGKHIKLAIAVSNLTDLKVHLGDRVKIGEVIAERTSEKTQLTAQKQQESLTLQKLQQVTAPINPQLKQIPAIAPLPPATYAAESATIESAKTRLAQTKRQYQLYQQADPRTLVETAALDLQSVNARQSSEAVIKQTQKIDELQGVAELPPEVVEHEGKLLEKIKDSDVKATAELQLKQAEVKASVLTTQAKLQQLSDEVGQAESNLTLAYSKLEKARNDRQHLEYQHSIELTRTTIQQNQARTELAKAQRDLAESERKRILDIETVKGKIAELDQKLGALAIYKAPIDGVVKRVKFVEQGSDGLLRCEIILATESPTIGQAFPPASFPGNSAD